MPMQLKVFTVAGSTGNYVTTLFLKETCTCPAKKDCYHILAAKLSIGMNMEAKKPAYLNLTQLCRNSCSKKRKSGRKRPREGDVEVIAAPDAADELDFQSRSLFYGIVIAMCLYIILI